MTANRTTLPLFNRIVVLLASSALVLGILYTAARGMQRNQPLDAATLFLGIVFFALGCIGIWFSLSWRNRSSEDLAEEQTLSTAPQPVIANEAFVYRFANGVKSAAVYLDDDVIHFYNCHTPRRFLATSDTWFSCSIGKLQGVYKFRYRGESLTVVTDAGKAIIREDGGGYAELRCQLIERVPQGSLLSPDHPLMGMVSLAGALAGLFAGVALTPRNANDSTLGLFVILGAGLGVAASYLLVWSAARLRRTSERSENREIEW